MTSPNLTLDAYNACVRNPANRLTRSEWIALQSELAREEAELAAEQAADLEWDNGTAETHAHLNRQRFTA